MKIQYFQDTDTLYILVSSREVRETKELNENTLLDLDIEGELVAITIEHASARALLGSFAYEQLPIAQAA